MMRREFIAALGASAVAWPVVAKGQTQDRIRRVGVLIGTAEDDPEARAWLAGFRQGLDKRGWSEGRNVSIVIRAAAGRGDRFPALAKELVASQPDVILAHAPPATAALQRESREIPIVFVSVSDPVGPGFVANLRRPGGNLTGMLTFEEGVTGKWLAMLKEVAPHLDRVALVSNPKTANYDYFLRTATDAASTLAIELLPRRIATAAEIEDAIVGLANLPNGGLLFPPDSTTVQNRGLIIALATRHRLPSVYPFRFYVADGGLMSYGIDQVEMFREAASYIDRILRGAKPADLPVQAPTKYTTVLNLKTARALGLDVPPSLLLRADEVIE